MTKHPALPYVLPFAVFVAFLWLRGVWRLPALTDETVRIGVIVALLLVFSRSAIDLRVHHIGGTLALGAGVFLLWIAPDTLIPGYRAHWLFQNPVTGSLAPSLSAGDLSDWRVLALRSVRTSLVVPVVEELFWRGWMMRWLISADFRSVALGSYTRWSFWAVALLFASEHGPYWDVGLLAGIAYNWWMVRTKSLGDLILAHALTNACLCAFVIATHRWEYWL